MKKTKIRLFLDLEKEERFINKMNKEGWKLEYIQFGIFYTFSKSKPNEYFTVMCATEKSKVLQMTSAAVLSGYESIPHTYDGIANILYLSGRKNEITEDFFNDNQDKLNHYKNIKNIYRYQAALIFVIGLISLLPLAITFSPMMTIFENLNLYCDEHLPKVLAPIISVLVLAALGIVFLAVALKALMAYMKTKKKYDALKSDMNLYE